MNHQFWSRTSQRNQNPSLNSRYVTNLLTKQISQQVYSKTDFTSPIKINERAIDTLGTLGRSNSVILKPNVQFNPERSLINKQEKQRSSRMSSFGSSSLSKLPSLVNDVEVYQKQRRGRQVDIISQVPRQYKDTIKVFPKIRFQNFDRDFWRRKSFIQGLPSNAYNYYTDQKLLNQKLSGGNTQANGLFTPKI